MARPNPKPVWLILTVLLNSNRLIVMVFVRASIKLNLKFNQKTPWPTQICIKKKEEKKNCITSLVTCVWSYSEPQVLSCSVGCVCLSSLTYCLPISSVRPPTHPQSCWNASKTDPRLFPTSQAPRLHKFCLFWQFVVLSVPLTDYHKKSVGWIYFASICFWANTVN